VDYDPILVGVGPSNPWMTDDLSFWEINKPIPEVATKKRLERWAISLEDTVTDPLGVQELLAFMKKEYCHENMRFWMSVQELKRGPGTESKIKKKVREIWEEFLSKGAGAEINIDSKTMEETKIAMKTPNRHTFDRAADHVYTLLLKKDCYPRFLRSEHYKSLLANSLNPGSSRKRFFNFPVRKKPSQNQPPNPGQPPGHTHTAREPRDFSIYGMEVKTDQECQDQSLTSSREFDEACPWEAEPPDVSRNRKVSNAGVHSNELPAQPPNSFKQRPSETSVNENAKPGRGPPHHIPLSNRKSFSEETSHVIKSTAAIGRLVHKREEEDKSAMEIDVGEDAVISSSNKCSKRGSQEHGEGKLSDASVLSLPPDSPKSQALQSKDMPGNSSLSDPTATPPILGSSHHPADLQRPQVTPRLSEVPARPSSDSIAHSHNTRSRKKSSESSFSDMVTSKDVPVGGEALSHQDVPVAYGEDLVQSGNVVGQAADEAMEDGEEDCWIAAEDVCPWEDDSLTPTWL